MIIETCPKCGHALQNLILTVNPPIPEKRCPSCGWSWTGKQEEVIRVPFGGNSGTPFAGGYADVSTSDIKPAALGTLNNTNAGTATLATQNFSPVNTTTTKQIEKLPYRQTGRVSVIPDEEMLAAKVNEIIDALNELTAQHQNGYLDAIRHVHADTARVYTHGEWGHQEKPPHPCTGCNAGWGSADMHGVHSCHETCERLAEYHRARTAAKGGPETTATGSGEQVPYICSKCQRLDDDTLLCCKQMAFMHGAKVYACLDYSPRKRSKDKEDNDA